ncbi:MAG: hypothetical protein Ct9H90mP16_02260 [Candidatus Poseidoniales archaeon]|nr:MAG: hypothetical protein Ct9H90mP16_02260 [Candidatus Poseidoniales archaeon]
MVENWLLPPYESQCPAGNDASFEAGIPIPSPVNHFNLSFWHWQHTDANDGMWLEYKLDNGPWTWVAPTGGYNLNSPEFFGNTCGTPKAV